MQTNLTNSYYTHNEQTPIQNKLLCVLLGLTLGFLVAFLHGLLGVFNPIIYLGFLLTIGFGYVLGIGYRIIAKLTKVRDKKFILLSSIFVVVFSMYASWVSYMNYYVLDGEALLSSYYSEGFLFFHPEVMIEILSEMYTYGVWSIGSMTVKGFPLLCIWIGELLLVFFTCYKLLKDYQIAPFSDRFNKWYTKYVLFDEFQSIPNETYFFEIDGNTVLDKINNLSNGKAMRFGRISIFYLENAQKNYLFFENMERDSKGKKEKGVVVIPGFPLTKEQAKEIIKTKHAKKQFFLNY